MTKAYVENDWLRQENKRLQMENDHLKSLQRMALQVPNLSSLQNRGFPDTLNLQQQSGTIGPGFSSHSIQIEDADLIDRLEKTESELKQTQMELQQTKGELKLMQEKVHTDMSGINQLCAFFM